MPVFSVSSAARVLEIAREVASPAVSSEADWINSRREVVRRSDILPLLSLRRVAGGYLAPAMGLGLRRHKLRFQPFIDFLRPAQCFLHVVANVFRPDDFGELRLMNQ